MVEKRIHSITFIQSNFAKIIRALEVNKTSGHDNISTCMIKLCSDSLAYPLLLILQNFLVAGTVTTQWKQRLLFKFVKRIINKQFQTIDRYLFCRYAVKFLKAYFQRTFQGV